MLFFLLLLDSENKKSIQIWADVKCFFFLLVSKIQHVGPLCLHLFIHFNNSWILQKSFQQRAFQLRMECRAVFFFFFPPRCIGRKVNLLETSVYEMTLFRLETGIYHTREWTQTPWTWAGREMQTGGRKKGASNNNNPGEVCAYIQFRKYVAFCTWAPLIWCQNKDLSDGRGGRRQTTHIIWWTKLGSSDSFVFQEFPSNDLYGSVRGVHFIKG